MSDNSTKMIFTTFNVATFIILFVINCIPIYFSHTRKKYAYYSTKIFALIFICFWIMLVAYFQTLDFMSFGTQSTKLSNTAMNRSDKTYVIYKDIYQNDLYNKVNTLNLILTVSAIQCVVVILLALFGVTWLNERRSYYIQVMLIHLALFCFCVFTINIHHVSATIPLD